MAQSIAAATERAAQNRASIFSSAPKAALPQARSPL
jgi:hypothetical protein